MATVHYCPACGTVKPYYRAPDEKPCCPDGYNVATDLETAQQAAMGFKVELILDGLAASQAEFLMVFARLRDTPAGEIIEEVRKFMESKP